MQSGLVGEGYKVTRLTTAGGFLQAGNTTFLCGTESEKVDRALEIIAERSSERTQKMPGAPSFGVGMYPGFPVEVPVGGATVFVVDVERYEKL